ncbi:MAG: hypothetical protein HKP61_15005 [Dactylosporangium sp.]|nr:hypothetical protein [Dactylosporangium sp.]NNJ62219.1 hypothetical protein [Dactylosporangium sp.]
MVKQAQNFNLRRWSSSTHTRVGLPLVIVVLFTIGMVQLWTGNTSNLQFTTAEQRGVAYLNPLTELMDRLVIAQSNAVRGSTVDTAGLRDALLDVDDVDQDHGSALGARQRWNDVRSRVDYLISLRPTGETAYGSYTDTIQLIDELIRKIADTSNLILDPTLDSYYLMDAAVLRLPSVLRFAGRASDLANLADSTEAPSGGEAARQAETWVSVARYQVSVESDEIATGLRKALDMTESTTLGPNITNQLDTFRTAVDAFVPPVNLLQNLDKVDTLTVTANAERVREAARNLLSVVLTELDSLLRVRAEAQSIRRSQGVGLGALGLILTGFLAWMLSSWAEPRATTRKPEEETNPAARTKSGDVERVTDDDLGQSQATEELVHAGRGIRARRRERTDNAR